MKPLIFRALVFILAFSAAFADNARLPDGTQFPLWEKPLHFSKTYYVDCQAKNADDNGPGTKDYPFRTINHAAQILQPGERVVIGSGVYREAIRPARGGTGPEAMISYEAAPGATVEVKGAAIVTGWQPSEGWNFGLDPETHQPVTPWELHLEPALFPSGYNPFALDNVTDNRYWINYAKDNMANYFRRRGLVFVDGKPLEPVEGPSELAGPSPRSLNFFSDIHWAPLFQEFSPYAGKVWIESDGLTLHIRLASDDPPAKHVIEITNQGSVFSPAKPYQTYIRVKGITFEYAGNSFPTRRRGWFPPTTAITSSLKTTRSNGPTASGSTLAASTGLLPLARARGLRHCAPQCLPLLRDRRPRRNRRSAECAGREESFRVDRMARRGPHVRIRRHQDAPHPRSATS